MATGFGVTKMVEMKSAIKAGVRKGAVRMMADGGLVGEVDPTDPQARRDIAAKEAARQQQEQMKAQVQQQTADAEARQAETLATVMKNLRAVGEFTE